MVVQTVVDLLLAHDFPKGSTYNALGGADKRAVDKDIVTKLMAAVPLGLSLRWMHRMLEAEDPDFFAFAEVKDLVNDNIKALNTANETYTAAPQTEFAVRYYFIPPNEDRPTSMIPIIKAVSGGATGIWTLTGKDTSSVQHQANVVVAVTKSFEIPKEYLGSDRRVEVLERRLEDMRKRLGGADPANPHG